MTIPVFSARDIETAVSPHEAYDAVRDAFVAYARGEWSMPPKVYVTNYPAGDFRAMPAIGGGHALLKWVTSFPGNPTARLADGNRIGSAFRRRRRTSPRCARCGGGHGATNRGCRRPGCRHPLPSGSVLVRRDRSWGQRSRDGAHADRAWSETVRLGCRREPSSLRRGSGLAPGSQRAPQKHWRARSFSP